VVRVPVGYEIGTPRPHELAALSGIEIAAAAIFPPEHIVPERREKGLPLTFFQDASSAGRLWVARTVEPAAPVGFAAAILLDGSAHLHEMDVLPGHGRRGVGRTLVLHVAQWARASGFVSLTLTTFRHLPWNAPFYASVGFAALDDRDLGPQLRAAMVKEAEHGLDPSKRVAMRLALRAAFGGNAAVEPVDDSSLISRSPGRVESTGQPRGSTQ
jgi:GNAT superfamily N-acetyltransferase